MDAFLWNNPGRLLHSSREVDDGHRVALTIATDLLWDDLLDQVLAHRPEEADFIRLLPPSFAAQAADDYRRWLATLATVAWKLGQPDPPPPATMAEQLCVGVLTTYASTAVAASAEEGTLDLEIPTGGLDFGSWFESYLEDVDHELLYQPEFDGIDDASTGYRYGFGRLDYEGAFAVFNEFNDGYHGLPNPMAEQRYSAEEAAVEQRLQAVVRELALSLAQAVVAGEQAVALPDPAVNVELAAHRVSRLLGVEVRVRDAEARVTGVIDHDAIDQIGWWLDGQAGASG